MNLTTISGHTEAFVVNAAGSLSKNDVVSFASDMTEGEAVIVNGSNVVVDATNIVAAGECRLVTKRNGTLRYSTPFSDSSTKVSTAQAYAAPTYKSMAIGYNGTTGSMDKTLDRELTVSLYDTSIERLFATKDMMNIANIVIESVIESEVALALFDSMSANFNRGEAFVHVALLLSGAKTTGAAAQVSNQGKIATFATAITAIAVGDYISFYGESYKVAKLENTSKTVTLTSPYQGASGTVAAGDVKRTTAAAAAGGHAGVKITAVERKYFRAGVTSAITFDFELGLKGFEVATLSTLASSTQGSGTARQIAELEWYAEGNQGTTTRMGSGLGVYPEFIPSVNMGYTYDQTMLTFSTSSTHTIFGGAPSFDNQLTVAVKVGVTSLVEAAIAAL